MKRTNSPRTNDYLANATAYALFFECLLEGETSMQDLQEETGLALSAIGKLIRILHRRKTIYIASWAQDPRGGYSRRVFKIGNKPDAKRPPRRTSGQRRKAQRARENLARLTNLGATA